MPLSDREDIWSVEARYPKAKEHAILYTFAKGPFSPCKLQHFLAFQTRCSCDFCVYLFVVWVVCIAWVALVALTCIDHTGVISSKYCDTDVRLSEKFKKWVAAAACLQWHIINLGAPGGAYNTVKWISRATISICHRHIHHIVHRHFHQDRFRDDLKDCVPPASCRLFPYSATLPPCPSLKSTTTHWRVILRRTTQPRHPAQLTSV